MKKDTIRDYATEAFRIYSLLGKPTIEEFKAKMKQSGCLSKAIPLIADIGAVNETLKELEDTKRDYIIKAVEAVYFVCPKRPMRKNEITERIIAFSLSYGASERTVFYWLKEARSMFASFRGLSENIIESLQ